MFSVQKYILAVAANKNNFTLIQYIAWLIWLLCYSQSDCPQYKSETEDFVSDGKLTNCYP